MLPVIELLEIALTVPPSIWMPTPLASTKFCVIDVSVPAVTDTPVALPLIVLR